MRTEWTEVCVSNAVRAENCTDTRGSGFTDRCAGSSVSVSEHRVQQHDASLTDTTNLPVRSRVQSLGEDVVRLVTIWSMYLNRIPSALLPCLLWLSFLPSPVAPTTMATDTAPPSSSAFVSASSPSSSSLSRPANTTLLFATGVHGTSLRNCTCSAPVSDCNEPLANLLCSCCTVLRSALPSAGLREPGGLTVWLREPWVLGELLNSSTVGHLRLALCGGTPVASQYLTLFGLRTLTIHSMAPGAPHPYQELNLEPAVGAATEGGSLSLNSLDTDPLPSPDPPSSSSSSSSSAFILHVTFLDVAVLNGLSTLKAYSVVGPPVSNLSQEFPDLPLALPVPSSSTPQDGHSSPGDPQLNSLLTFVY